MLWPREFKSATSASKTVRPLFSYQMRGSIGCLLGGNIVRVVCPCFSLGQRYNPEQVAANSCVLAEGDVRMVKIIHIVKADASGTIGADQLGRLRFAPLKQAFAYEERR